jgi:hypothetical protein
MNGGRKKRKKKHERSDQEDRRKRHERRDKEDRKERHERREKEKREKKERSRDYEEFEPSLLRRATTGLFSRDKSWAERVDQEEGHKKLVRRSTAPQY